MKPGFARKINRIIKAMKKIEGDLTSSEIVQLCKKEFKLDVDHETVENDGPVFAIALALAEDDKEEVQNIIDVGMTLLEL